MIDLEQYRDPWLAEKVNEYIGFYPRELYVLDNFSAFAIEYQGVLYQTVEHAYQALGFIISAPEIYEEIVNSKSAHEAQKIAHENKEKRRSDWGDVRVGIMEDLLRAKVSQHPYVKRKLLETKDYVLCEDSPKDSFYGCGPDRKGENILGKLWMKLRTELRSGMGMD